MKGEVGDWQSKMPLEYSSAFEPGGNKTTRRQARGRQVRQVRLRRAGWHWVTETLSTSTSQRRCSLLLAAGRAPQKGKPLLAPAWRAAPAGRN